MSHAATHWLATIPPEQMTHGEFRVMFHLCDCHNASMGCFPKQEYLRRNTGLSNGGLNKALGQLEEKGMIRRERERDARTNRQKATRYILGFEAEGAQKPSPLSGAGKEPENSMSRLHPGGAGAVSTQGAEPSPLSGEGRLHPSGDAYKEEPVKEPVKEPCAAPGAPHTQDFDFGEILDQFLAVYPRPVDAEATEAELRKAIGGGADPDHILAAARAYAGEQKGNKRQYIAYSENWLRQGRWKRYPAPGPELTPEERQARGRQQMADAITSGKTYLCVHISAAQGRDLVQAGLVTAEQCRDAGVHL